LKVIQPIEDRKLSQKEAANKFNLCVRQVRRLQQNYKQDGAKALVSKRRG
jgi:transposase